MIETCFVMTLSETPVRNVEEKVMGRTDITLMETGNGDNSAVLFLLTIASGEVESERSRGRNQAGFATSSSCSLLTLMDSLCVCGIDRAFFVSCFTFDFHLPPSILLVHPPHGPGRIHLHEQLPRTTTS